MPEGGAQNGKAGGGSFFSADTAPEDAAGSSGIGRLAGDAPESKFPRRVFPQGTCRNVPRSFRDARFRYRLH
jgi:hypothetical protein